MSKQTTYQKKTVVTSQSSPARSTEVVKKEVPVVQMQKAVPVEQGVSKKDDSSPATKGGLLSVLIGLPISAALFVAFFGFILPKSIELLSGQSGQSGNVEGPASPAPLVSSNYVGTSPAQSVETSPNPESSAETGQLENSTTALVFDPPSNIRSLPDGPVLCSVKDKVRIPLKGKEGDWWKTDYCGELGYIHDGQISLEME